MNVLLRDAITALKFMELSLTTAEKEVRKLGGKSTQQIKPQVDQLELEKLPDEYQNEMAKIRSYR